MGVQSGDDVEGLLYVPILPPNSPCNNVAGQYIPTNATRLANLPSTDYPYIAFAPWINAECTLAFLYAASPSSDAFLTYLLDNGTTTPPPLISQAWSLNDGGSTWGQLKFPVYAIPGANGITVMQNLALYSGNISAAPNSQLLLEQFAPTDYVRLYSTFDTGSGDHYPTLWAFLLIILGIVIVLVCVTSFAMHYRQRRARNLLRRRVLAGEVDLESLGLAKPPRMKQSDIDTLPQIVYTPSEEKPPLPLNDPLPPSSSTDTAMSSAGTYNQPTCPICLEDYVAGKSIVRTLPCHHIYHPACIDPHLLSSSSLCPVCKARVPSAQDQASANGASVPVITNAMVRRERYIRLVRERRQAQLGENSHMQWFQRHFGRPLLPIVGRGMRPQARPPSTQAGNTSVVTTNDTSTVTAPSPGQIEMGVLAPAGLPPTSDVNTTSSRNAAEPTVTSVLSPEAMQPRPPAEDPEGRREWARRRASALLHRQSIVRTDGNVDIEEEERRRIASLPRWRRVLGSVFPGLKN